MMDMEINPKLYRRITEIRVRFARSGPGGDTQLIAYARIDIQNLLAEIDSLRARLATATQTLQELQVYANKVLDELLDELKKE